MRLAVAPSGSPPARETAAQNGRPRAARSTSGAHLHRARVASCMACPARRARARPSRRRPQGAFVNLHTDIPTRWPDRPTADEPEARRASRSTCRRIPRRAGTPSASSSRTSPRRPCASSRRPARRRPTSRASTRSSRGSTPTGRSGATRQGASPSSRPPGRSSRSGSRTGSSRRCRCPTGST